MSDGTILFLIITFTVGGILQFIVTMWPDDK